MSKTKFKIIVSDIDGTLLNTKHRLGERTRDAVRRLMDAGYIFGIATGRNIVDAYQIGRQIGAPDFYITSNGANISDSSGSSIYMDEMDPDVIKGILEIDKPDGVFKNLYQGRRWLMEEPEVVFTEYHEDGNLLPEIIDFAQFRPAGVQKMFFTATDGRKLVPIQDIVRERFGKRVDVTFSMNKCLEIMSKNINKGIAVGRVAKSFGADLTEVMVFGDGLNDLEMLDIAGRGYIMRNSNSRLRELLPGLEVIGSNSEDGVAAKINELFGKEEL